MFPPLSNAETASPAALGWVERAVVDQQGPLLRYAGSLLGDPDRARDVVQDTFVRLMAQPPGAVNGHLTEWLFTVCRHRALDVLRKEGRLQHFAEGELERLTAAGPRPGRQLEETETREEIVRLIDRLPPNQREVIRLKFQQGFSYKEIARITTLSVGNVGFLIHTAVQRLRRDLAAQGP